MFIADRLRTGRVAVYEATQNELVEVIADVLPGAEYAEVSLEQLRRRADWPAQTVATELAAHHGTVFRVDGRWIAPHEAPAFATWFAAKAFSGFGSHIHVCASADDARRAAEVLARPDAAANGGLAWAA